MPENIIDRLKAKEDEMEALIKEARKKAAAIKERAVKKSISVKGAGAAELDEKIDEMRAAAKEEVARETERLENEAAEAAESIRVAAAEMEEEAMALVVRLIAEGIDDREDD
jgi:hypothetical protein